MDVDHLRGVLANLLKHLDHNDRKRLHEYLGNDIPRRIQDDQSLQGTLKVFDSLFDQAKINEEDFTLLINAFDEIQCIDAATVLRKHRQYNKLHGKKQSIESLSQMLPIIDRLLKDCKDKIESSVPNVNITTRNEIGNHNIMMNSNNAHINTTPTTPVNHELEKTKSKKTLKSNLLMKCRKHLSPLNIFLIMISALLTGYLIYKHISEKIEGSSSFNGPINLNRTIGILYDQANRSFLNLEKLFNEKMNRIQNLTTQIQANTINTSSSVSSTSSRSDCSYFVQKNGWDFFGNDIGNEWHIAPNNYDECCAACARNHHCNAFTWRTTARHCYLKSTIGVSGRPHSDAIAAYRPGIGEIMLNVPYQLMNAESKKCLTTFNESTLDQTKVQTSYDTHSLNQIWNFRQSKDGSVKLVHVKSGKALTVHEGHEYNGSHVQISTDNNLNSQRWRLKPVTNGHFELIHVSSGKALQATRSMTDNVVNVELWSENESIAQRWRLILFEETVKRQTIAGGFRGSMTHEFQSPNGLAIDENQTLYISDCNNHRIIAWKRNATAGEVLVDGKNDHYQFNQLYYPTTVIFDQETNSLLICDDGNRRVMRYSLHAANNTTADDEIKLVIANIDCGGLALGSNGSLYVSDYAKHEVRRYEKNGDTNGIQVAGSNQSGQNLHELNEPSYLFVDGQANLYVSDTGNHRVMKWMHGSTSGIIVAGGHGNGNSLKQLSYPRGIVVDQEEHVYVVDSLNNRIVRWDKQANQGMVIDGGDRTEKADKNLNEPDGLCVDRHAAFYVADKNNHRIKLFFFSNIE